jgi:hypothetical protein
MAYIGKIPAAAALTADDITDGIITNAKLAQDIISGDTALGAEPADTDEFLVSDAGTLKRIDYSLIKGGGITEADQWRLTSDISDSSWTLNANLERNDTAGFSVLGTGMSESSGIFTFPSTGYWLVMYDQTVTVDGDRRAIYARVETTHDNSTYVGHYSADSVTRAESNYTACFVSSKVILDVTDTTQVKCKFTGSSTGTCLVSSNTAANTTYMTFIRLGDT